MHRALLSLTLAAVAGGCGSSLGSVVVSDRTDHQSLCAPRSNTELASMTDLALARWRPTLRVLELRREGLEPADAQLLGALLEKFDVLGIEPRPPGPDVDDFHSFHLNIRPGTVRIGWAVSPNEVDATLLGAVTGERVPGARDVQVSRTSIDGNAAFWAVVTLGVSSLGGSPIKTQTSTERWVPGVSDIAAAAPVAGRLVRLLRQVAPQAHWFVVPRGTAVDVIDEMMLSPGPCTITIALHSPLVRTAETSGAVRSLPFTSWSSAYFQDHREGRRLFADR